MTTPNGRWQAGGVGLLMLAAGLVYMGGCFPLTLESPAVPAAERPADWAQPIHLPELSNLARITAGLYRGAQPSAAGFAELKKLGIRTDIDLRFGQAEKQQAVAAGLRYVNIPMHAWHPEDEDIVAFLKTVSDPQRAPFFVHCKHGSDRTGVCIAAYRVAVQGWPKREAIRETTGGGYGFHEIWQDLVDYIRNMDVAAIRRQAGLEAAES